ncbi:stearoyl-CoA desaturase 5-like [Oppia nitens]|uniref:stearoyl-CoA desaturase 5-like n=1 Tax=Oppia nitens TaxID=1686743 RepID=UPI0023DA9FC3|nr:stearoyl-CoA desaturase 5-like [Oppia nitens]
MFAIKGLLTVMSNMTIQTKLLQLSRRLYNRMMYWNGWRIVWPMVWALAVAHAGAMYGLYLLVFGTVMWQTLVWQNCIHLLTAPGITAGAHRLWSHRSFKARWPLRLYLMIAQTLSLQRDIYSWSADHRIHHKYSETDADPHNANRGFFYAHMGWLFVEQHPEVIKKAKNIDLSDLLDDPIVYYQRLFYLPLVAIIWFAIPVLIPCYLWDETFINSLFISITRYIFMLHCAFMVNSVAHLWGIRPYDKNINPAESQSVTWLTLGEGYHNYHHVFPYDYSTGEYSWDENFNLTTWLIDWCARYGLAYDLKKPSADNIEQTKLKRGNSKLIHKPSIPVLDYVTGIGVQTWIIWLPLTIRLLLTIATN